MKTPFLPGQRALKLLALILLAMVFLPQGLYGQGQTGNQGSDDGDNTGLAPNAHAGFKENTIPPSPGAYQMTKYADSPVSYSLGTVDISIPLYTIKSRELSVPISLSYNSSGIRVDEVPASVGLGWSLNAGGVITRTVVGIPDEEYGDRLDLHINDHNYFIWTWSDIISGRGYDLKSIMDNRQDSFHDKYTYNYNGNTGSFIVKRASVGGDLIVEKTSVSDDKIELITEEDGRVGHFIITDSNGVKYTFGDVGLYSNLYTEYVSYEVLRSGESLSLSEGNPEYGSIPSSWYLATMESADGTDVIDFSYINLGEWKKELLSLSKTYESSTSPFVYDQGGLTNYTKSWYNYENTLAIGSIEFNGNTVNFEYKLSNSPIIIMGEATNQSSGLDHFYIPKNKNWNQYLSTIAVSNMENETVWQADISQDFGFGDNRLRLCDVKIFGKYGTVKTNGYKFDYNTAPEEVNLKYYARDWYGYYNGFKDSVHHMIPYDISRGYLENRDPDIDFAKAYSLKTISTMSGAKTEFEYESNKGIGLRIKSIKTSKKDFSGDSYILVKTRSFNYYDEDNTNSRPTIPMPGINDYTTYSESWKSGGMDSGGSIFNNRYHMTIGPSPVLPGASFESAKMFYKKVTEDVYDNAADTIRVTYNYDDSWVSNTREEVRSDYNPLWQHTEEINNDPARHDANHYYLRTSKKYYDKVIGEYRDISYYDKETALALTNLKSKEYFKKEGGQFVPVKREESDYRQANAGSVRTGLFARNILGAGVATADGVASFEPGSIGNPRLDCFFFDVSEDISTTKVTESRTIDIFDGQEKITTTTYSFLDHSGETEAPPAIYPNQSLDLTTLSLKSKKIVSDDEERLYKYYYPSDYKTSGNVYQTMFDRHQIYTPVKEEVVVRNTATNETDTFRTETEYKEFTVGNRTMIKPGKVATYLGATKTQEYEIKEYDKYGNPVYVTLNGNKNACYIWGYNGTALIAEINNATYNQVTSALNLSSLTIEDIVDRTSNMPYTTLEGLRESPLLSSAQITIYRHKPLVGIQSVTDPSGRKLTYQYDNANRLQFIRDEDDNIVEKYEYNFPENY